MVSDSGDGGRGTVKGSSSRERVNVRRGLVEQEIYDHATRLFAERGFAGTSFQDIADAVGLTRPALYHYVSSKDALLAKLVAEITEEPAKEMAAIAARRDVDAAAKLHEIVAATVLRQGAQPARFQLLIRSEADLPPEVAKAHEAARRAVLRAIVGIVEEGVESGVFRTVDARTASLGVIGIMNWVAWWYSPGTRNDLDAVADELAELAVAGLVDTEGRAPADGPRAVVRSLRGQLDRLEKMLDA